MQRLNKIQDLLLANAKAIQSLSDIHKEISIEFDYLKIELGEQAGDATLQKPKFEKPNIIQVAFPDNQYVKEQTEKVGWVLHHTAGSQEGKSVYDTWAMDKQGRVGTAYVINRDGTISSGFDAQKYWSHAIGLTVNGNNLPANLSKYHTFDNNVFLNKRYIQIELCSWGCLTEKNGKFITWANREVKLENVITYETPFRTFKHYERYTVEQIEALRKLILWHNSEFGLSKKYNEDMWDISEKALQGSEGIWGHTSFRTDKSDLHPQKEILEMLQSL